MAHWNLDVMYPDREHSSHLAPYADVTHLPLSLQSPRPHDEDTTKSEHPVLPSKHSHFPFTSMPWRLHSRHAVVMKT